MRITRVVAVLAALSLLSACGGGAGGGGGGSSVTPTTTNTPTSSPIYVSCAQSGVSPSVVHVAAHTVSRLAESVRRLAPFHFTGRTSVSQTLIGVTYASSTIGTSSAAVAREESSAGATFVRSVSYPRAGLVMHVLSVPSSQAASIESTLRRSAGVENAGNIGSRRFLTTVSQAYFSNDPYFDGFSTTYHVGPYDESDDIPGQWGMHAVCLGDAFEYSQSGNGSGITNADALGSSSIKVALIDTGVDMTHPELSSKVVYYKRFVEGTESAGEDDEWGHGTDTAGIAGADMNNALGFVGAGGNVELYEYQVFQNPDSNCSNPETTDPACSASTSDIASAIEDAISQGVNVISMSLGGSCPDATDEGDAVADAIAAHIIVVAAAGNGGTGQVDSPACDAGVIAAGATGLADGQLNGAGNMNGSASSPIEYVASYSNWGSPGSNPQSASAWGIVAPGGDPSSDSDADDLHWIEDIWTSTPHNSSYEGTCTGDYPTDTGTTDCRIDIAGTSMATPLVAGAAGLILSVNSSYQSGSAMKTLLCETADNIEDSREGCGRLNVYRAMAKALGDPNIP